MTASTLAGQHDQWAAQQGLGDADRCTMLVRNPLSFLELHRCARPAVSEVHAGCVHEHVDVDRLCVEHALKAGDGTYCNECATTANPADRHACPIRVIDRRSIR